MPKTVFRMPDKLTIWQLKKFLTKGMPQVKQNPKYVHTHIYIYIG